MAGCIRPPRPRERGMVLIAMLVVVILIAGTSVVFLDEGLRARAEVDQSEHDLRALNAARAGALRAEMEILSGVDADGDGLGTVTGSFAGATFDVAATDVGSGRYRLLAVGHRGNARRRIAIGVRKASSGPFQDAMFGEESVKLTGGSHTDSYDSDLGTWLSQAIHIDGEGLPYATAGGHVGSNGEIVLSAPVRGDAIPGPGFEVDHGEEAWGSTTPRTEPRVVPLPSFEAFQAAWAANDNADIDVSHDKVSYDPDEAILGSGGGAPITLTGGTYIFNTLKMTGGGNLRITGPTVIYITNHFEISGGGVVNLTNNPANCIIYCHPYDFPAGSKHDKMMFKTSGGSDTVFAVHGPTFHLETSGGGTFFGALVGNTIVFSGGSAFHYDEALGNLGGGGGTSGIVREYVLHLD